MQFQSIPMDRLDFGLEPEFERRTIWPPAGEANYSENDGLWFYDEGQKIGVHAWLGHSGAQYPEAFERLTVFLPGNELLVRTTRGPQHTDEFPAGPYMTARCEAPFERWRFTYDGPAHPTTPQELARGPLPPAAETVSVALDARARMIAPAFPQGGFYKDRKDFLAAPASHFFGGRRCEQVLFAEGRLRIGDVWFHISGPGLRTHRKGVRTMQTTGGTAVPKYTGHRWAHAVFPSGLEIYHTWFGGADGVPIDGSEAFVRRDGVFHRAEVIDPMPMRLDGTGDEASFSLRTRLGETQITCEVIADSFQSLLAPDFFGVQWDSPNPGTLAMSQAFVRYRHERETTINMMERSVGLGALQRPR
jgi:hypothetical protein